MVTVIRENHPQVAELFRLVKYHNLPRFIERTSKNMLRWAHWISWLVSNWIIQLPSTTQFYTSIASSQTTSFAQIEVEGACEARRPALSEALSLAELGLALRVLPGVQMTAHLWVVYPPFSEVSNWILWKRTCWSFFGFLWKIYSITLHDLLILFLFLW